nr:hypothetical protein [Moritella viscosa]SHO15770.1 Multi-sensor signal transduction histidine kinase [Moritella viscosa]
MHNNKLEEMARELLAIKTKEAEKSRDILVKKIEEYKQKEKILSTTIREAFDNKTVHQASAKIFKSLISFGLDVDKILKEVDIYNSEVSTLREYESQLEIKTTNIHPFDTKHIANHSSLINDLHNSIAMMKHNENSVIKLEQAQPDTKQENLILSDQKVRFVKSLVNNKVHLRILKTFLELFYLVKDKKDGLKYTSVSSLAKNHQHNLTCSAQDMNNTIGQCSKIHWLSVSKNNIRTLTINEAFTKTDTLINLVNVLVEKHLTLKCLNVLLDLIETSDQEGFVLLNEVTIKNNQHQLRQLKKANLISHSRGKVTINLEVFGE